MAADLSLRGCRREAAMAGRPCAHGFPDAVVASKFNEDFALCRSFQFAQGALQRGSILSLSPARVPMQD